MQKFVLHNSVRQIGFKTKPSYPIVCTLFKSCCDRKSFRRLNDFPLVQHYHLRPYLHFAASHIFIPSHVSYNFGSQPSHAHTHALSLSTSFRTSTLILSSLPITEYEIALLSNKVISFLSSLVHLTSYFHILNRGKSKRNSVYALNLILS